MKTVDALCVHACKAAKRYLIESFEGKASAGYKIWYQAHENLVMAQFNQSVSVEVYCKE